MGSQNDEMLEHRNNNHAQCQVDNAVHGKDALDETTGKEANNIAAKAIARLLLVQLLTGRSIVSCIHLLRLSPLPSGGSKTSFVVRSVQCPLFSPSR